MAFCTKCGKEISNGAAFCPYCGAARTSTQQTPMQYTPMQQARPVFEEKVSWGWGLLSFLIPLAGLILYLSWKDSKPNGAKMAGKWALIGVAFNVFTMIISN